MIGVTQQAASEITKNFNSKLFCSEYESGMTPEKIAEALGMSFQWVKKYDPTRAKRNEKSYAVTFFGYNVWGFKDEIWH